MPGISTSPENKKDWCLLQSAAYSSSFHSLPDRLKPLEALARGLGCFLCKGGLASFHSYSGFVYDQFLLPHILLNRPGIPILYHAAHHFLRLRYFTTPRRHHPLQPRLRAIAARPPVENRNPKTALALPPLHRSRNCRSKTSVSDAIRYPFCGLDQRPTRSRTVPRAPHVYGRYPARAKAQSRARLASHRNISRTATLDGASDARATLWPRT